VDETKGHNVFETEIEKGMAVWLVLTSTKSFSKLGQWKVLKKT